MFLKRALQAGPHTRRSTFFSETLMQTKLIHADGDRTYAVVFESFEDPVAGLKRFAVEQNLSAASF